MRLGYVVMGLMVFVSCKKNEQLVITPQDYHESVDKVTEVMIHDIFSPPVASRSYAYPKIAAYEILALKNEGHTS